VSEALQLATNAVGVSCGTSDAVNYVPAATCALVVVATEANAAISYQTAGTLLSLQANKTAGNRTGGLGMHVGSNIAGSEGSLVIDFTTTNGQYEDVAHTDAVSAGQTVSWKTKAGGSGNANLTLTDVGGLWAATGTTTCHFAATGALSYSVSSETSFRHPADRALKTTTQAQGEWKCRLPAGVDHVTAKNIEVRVSANTSTNSITYDTNGATGTGTSPSVTIAGSSGAITAADTSNSIQIKDTDLFALKTVTGSGTVALTCEFIAIEIQSDDNVFHFIMGAANGALSNSTNDCFSLAGRCAKVASGSEANVQSKSELTASTVTVSCLAAYVACASTTPSFTLRQNAADTALTVSLPSSGTAWQEDTTHSVVLATTDLCNYQIGTSPNHTFYCVALTVQNTVPSGFIPYQPWYQAAPVLAQ
jgi:hypothetical protein